MYKLFIISVVLLTSVEAISLLENREQKCKAGDNYSCYFLGVVYFYGKGVEKDYKKSEHYYKEGCKHGDISSCYELGKEYYFGGKFPKSMLEASKYLKKSCEAESRGCNLLGNIYMLAKYKDYKKALTYHVKACINKNPKGCMSAALMYQKGYGVSKDVLEAREYYTMACRYGEQKVCELLGIPTHFTLTINSEPKDAKVTILGVKKYRNGISLPRQNYSIYISKEGYLPHIENLVLQEDTTLNIQLKEFGLKSSKNTLTASNPKPNLTPVKVQQTKKQIAYADNGKVWYDLQSKLTWQNEPYTASEKEATLSYPASTHGKVQTHSEAKRYCNNLELGGYSDWRLPSRKEWSTVKTKMKHHNWHIKPALAKGVKGRIFWASDTKGSNEVWVDDLMWEKGYWALNTGINFVRCVRGGK